MALRATWRCVCCSYDNEDFADWMPFHIRNRASDATSDLPAKLAEEGDRKLPQSPPDEIILMVRSGTATPRAVVPLTAACTHGHSMLRPRRRAATRASRRARTCHTAAANGLREARTSGSCAVGATSE
jgi:hypothetical protein